jgi:rod shape-determining protein MreC
MNRLLIILVVAAVGVAVILSTLKSGAMQSAQGTFFGLLSPFLKTSSAVKQQIGAVGTGLKTLDQLETENRELTTANKELRASNQILRDIEAENNKLRSALGYRERSVFKLLPARVISRDASTWWTTVMINRGFEDGVESDQPVITDGGLFGKTTTVGKNVSSVLLITDETCKVAVKIEGTREQGICSGLRVQENGHNSELQVNFLSKSADLQPGQKVYTAGVNNGVFPSGILVGQVKSFQARALDGRATIEPAIDPSLVEDVFVVVGAK